MSLASQIRSVIVSLVVLSMPGMAWAAAGEVTLHNLIGADIYAVYVAPADTHKWSDELLQGERLPEDGQVTIHFPNSSTVWWDLRVENRYGLPLEWKKIPLRRLNTLILQLRDGQPVIRGH